MAPAAAITTSILLIGDAPTDAATVYPSAAVPVGTAVTPDGE